MVNRYLTPAVRMVVLLLVACTPLMAQRASEPAAQTSQIVGQRILFADGSTLDVDDTWKQGDTLWYRRQGTSQSTDRAVKKVENRYKETAAASPNASPASTTSSGPAHPTPAKIQAVAAAPATWIYLVDGARLRVDEVR